MGLDPAKSQRAQQGYNVTWFQIRRQESRMDFTTNQLARGVGERPSESLHNEILMSFHINLHGPGHGQSLPFDKAIAVSDSNMLGVPRCALAVAGVSDATCTGHVSRLQCGITIPVTQCQPKRLHVVQVIQPQILSQSSVRVEFGLKGNHASFFPDHLGQKNRVQPCRSTNVVKAISRGQVPHQKLDRLALSTQGVQSLHCGF
jgi:hypothetical protein